MLLTHAASVVVCANFVTLLISCREKIRNLEIRLARTTTADPKLSELWSADMLAQKGETGGRQPQHDDAEILIPPREPPTSYAAKNERNQTPLASSCDCQKPAATENAQQRPSTPSHNITRTTVAAANGSGGGTGSVGWSARLKKFEGQLRQGLEVLGAKTIRSNIGFAAMTKTVRSPMPQRGVEKGAAGLPTDHVGAQNARKILDDGDCNGIGMFRKDGPQHRATGAEVEEFWGSDYCTSA